MANYFIAYIVVAALIYRPLSLGYDALIEYGKTNDPKGFKKNRESLDDPRFKHSLIFLASAFWPFTLMGVVVIMTNIKHVTEHDGSRWVEYEVAHDRISKLTALLIDISKSESRGG